MAAGLGFKDFVTGEVLTAADVDGYLMQGVWVFASATARDAAVTSPQEGNFAYLKDTNVTTYYTGSAWANLDTTGMTNPMTTTGDVIYSSSGSTPARLGIGSTGDVLTVAGGVPSWAAPGGGAFALVQSGSLTSNNTFSFNSVFTSTYTNYKIMIKLSSVANANDDLLMKMRASGSDSTTGLTSQRIAGDGTSASASRNTSNASNWLLGLCGSGNPTIATYTLDIFTPQEATRTTFQCLTIAENASVIQNTYMSGFAADNTQYDGFTLTTTGNISGTYKIYGYGN